MNRLDLEDETPPPTHLKGRVLASLRARGLVEPARARRSILQQLAAAAACLLIGFAGGVALRRAPAGDGTAPRFLLLLYEDSTYQVAARPEERAAEYGAWARELAEQGRTISGEELGSDSQVVASPSASAAGTLGTLGGFFLLDASDAADAAQVARASPHLKYGGTIVVRPIMVR
jgi:hypothetical protein